MGRKGEERGVVERVGWKGIPAVGIVISGRTNVKSL